MRVGRPDNMDTYCQAVLSALERLLDAGGNISLGDLAQRRDEWMRAYLHTPHGKPVELCISDDGGLYPDLPADCGAT
jgi:hypothetical protein